MQAEMAEKMKMGRKFWGPKVMMFASTRVALGVGIGLCLSRKLSKEEAKAAGTALIAMGAVTTLPFAIAMACGKHWHDHGEGCHCPKCDPEAQATPAAEPSSA
jgi:hypothetical protein